MVRHAIAPAGHTRLRRCYSAQLGVGHWYGVLSHEFASACYQLAARLVTLLLFRQPQQALGNAYQVRIRQRALQPQQCIVSTALRVGGFVSDKWI